MDAGLSLNTIDQNATSDQSAVEVHAESGRMDAGLSLDTIDQNATNDQSAVEVHAESGRMDAGPSLDTIDQNATNDQSAGNAESKRMDTGLSLDTIKQNGSKHESDGNRLEEIVSGNNEDNEIALRESDENQKSALDELKNNMGKEGLLIAFKCFSEVLNNWQDRPVKLAVTGKSGIASSEENWKSAAEKNINKERLDTELEHLNEDLDDWKNEPVKLAVTGKSGIASSEENCKSAAEKLKDNINKEGLDTALEHLSKDLDDWKNEPVKLAVTGKSGIGKSSFINAIRNLKLGDPGFATSSSAGNTTKDATFYEYPGNPKITLHDLPGFGTIALPTNGYETKMELYRYDYILIFVGNIEENDIEIAKKIKEMKKPFCFVRSKIDLDIQNARNDGELEREAVEKIISKSSSNLKNAGFNKAKFFVISNRNKSIYQFHDLVSYIQSNLPGLKYDAVMFSILGVLSVDVINSKYEILKDRILKVSVTSVALTTAPLFGKDMVFNMALICKELLLYHKAFGFEQQFVKDTLKHDYVRRKLNANSIIEVPPANKTMHTFVKNELEKLRTSEGRENPNVLITHFLESVVPEWSAGAELFAFLKQVLDGCRDDAKLVYSEMMNVDV